MTSNSPGYVIQLQDLFGAPSQSGFGSAVFYDESSAGSGAESLEAYGLSKYRYFCGDKWDQFGEDAWLSGWKLVYQRDVSTTGAPVAKVSADSDTPFGIVAELRAIPDRSIRSLIPMLIDEVEDPVAAQSALTGGFDSPEVSELAIYSVGDGAAMSGVMIVGRRGTNSLLSLVLLLD